MRKAARFVFILILFLNALSTAVAQELNWTATINGPINHFTTDPFGNSYVLRGNELTQYDSLGVKRLTYGQRNLGGLRCIDASNPMKIVLLYPDFARLEILDSKLAMQRSIDLRGFGIQQPLLACTSLSGGIWIFDQQDFQLKKYSEQMQILTESGNIAQRTGYELRPTQLIEYENRLYLNCPQTGVLVFDAFGTYLKLLPISGVYKLAFSGERMLYCKSGKAFSYRLDTFEEQPFLLPEKSGIVKELRIEQQKIFLNNADKIELYRF